jgi:hypothetical protein
MKRWIFRTILVIVCIGFLRFIDDLSIPGWIVLIIGVAALLNFVSWLYDYRASLAPQSIPTKGYDTRRNALEQAQKQLELLQFEKIDEFYLARTFDVVFYVLHHRSQPMIACLYHDSSHPILYFTTYYDDDSILTTSSAIGHRMMPLPSKIFLQVFNKVSYQELLKHHTTAYAFLQQRGLTAISLSSSHQFRPYFIKEECRYAEHRRTIPWLSLKQLYWGITAREKMYHNSIEEQYH